MEREIMKFEQGKEYLDRDGNKYRFIGLDDCEAVFRRLFDGLIVNRNDGGFMNNGGKENKLDIISEHVEPEIEVETQQVWICPNDEAETVSILRVSKKYVFYVSYFGRVVCLPIAVFRDCWKPYRNADGSLVENSNET